MSVLHDSVEAYVQLERRYLKLEGRNRTLNESNCALRKELDALRKKLAKMEVLRKASDRLVNSQVLQYAEFITYSEAYADTRAALAELDRVDKKE